jgi:type I restriction enzyme S subunit
MFAAYAGDIVFSKIDARQGAIGLVPDAISKAVVTSEFPVFIPNSDMVEKTYLGLLARTPHFILSLAAKASGTSGRKRVTPAAFDALAIPLPKLEEQRALVAAHDAAIAIAESDEAEAEAVEREAADAFAAALGLAEPPPLPDRPVLVARFVELDRWAHEALLRRSTPVQSAPPTFPLVSVAAVGRVSYGIQKSPGNRPDKHARPYLRVANVQRNRLDLREVKMIDVPDDEFDRFKLQFGDLLLCEGNSPDLVGRGAIWRDEIPGCVHQNHVLRVRLDVNRCLPEFLLAVINSKAGQAYFRSKSKRTTNLASINSKEVSAFAFPLPPLDVQRELIEALSAANVRAAALREEAAATRSAARQQFEQALYGA